MAGRKNSSTQLLDELEELSQSLYQPNTSTNRRTASLVLPRNAVPPIPSIDEIGITGPDEEKLNPKPRSRRMSLSLWRSRPKPENNNDQKERPKAHNQKELKKLDDKASSSEKKGLWNWKPIRALSHIGMQKLSCLFSIEVVIVQGLPASMNGLRLCVCVRKKETKDGTVQTMPSRVSQGAADFEETLFVRCHVYCSHVSGNQMKFEPRPFLIYVLAVDAEELDFGKTYVDLSQLIQESIEKNLEGTRIRQWDTNFTLSGKAKGGELVLKLGFQNMEKDGGTGIYSQPKGQNSSKARSFSPSFGRRQSKSSFSIPSPRMSSRAEAWTPSQTRASTNLQEIDDLNLDEPAPVPSPSPPAQKFEELEAKVEDLDLPEFDVVDKGVEVQDKDWTDEGHSEENSDKRSVSTEVVKEIVHDQLHQMRLTELDSIAQQIKALESLIKEDKQVPIDEETGWSQKLDADEETVTKEFMQLLEDEEANEIKITPHVYQEKTEDSEDAESKVFLPDLGKGLGCVVQTRNGGYLASVNPLDTLVAKKETPKLAIQVSKQLVLPLNKSMSGFELFQSMASIGLEKLSSEILSLMPIDELKGKTAEQIAFEGIASAIISGRNKEGASSTAARTIAAVKSMATAMSTGRKERISTGIWNVSENPVTLDEILALSMQKIESMAVEALKIQAEMAEEDAPFDVSPLNEYPIEGSEKDKNHPLASAVPFEDWIKESSFTSNYKSGDSETIVISAVVQTRDPLRQYEAVGAPMLALIYATQGDTKPDNYGEEKRFEVVSLHIGCLKVRTEGKKNVWDSEKQRLTSMQWLVAHGIGKAAKKGKRVISKGHDLLWSISSRVMADMWLKPMRNPDVRFNE